MQPHELALSRAKIGLMSRPNSVFYSTLLCGLRQVFDDSIPTACTDGKSILINPKFWMELDAEEQIFLLLHEVFHVAYLHVDPGRRAGREPRKWNYAGDHVINLQLIAAGFKMPSGKNQGLADPQYKGMSVEEVFDIIPTPPPSFDKHCDIKEGTGDPETLQRELEDLVIRAATASRLGGDKPGTIPGDVQIMLDKLQNPKLPWYRILQKYLHGMAKDDYSFKRPNRRFFPKYYLPSLHSTKLMDLVIAVDASGSVSDKDFNQFVSEMRSIFKMMKPSKMTIIQFDTRIISVDRAHSVDELLAIKFSGRGGTAIGPVLNWAEENKPQLLMMFTDGYFAHPRQKAPVETLWLIHNNARFKAPYGKVIHYEV